LRQVAGCRWELAPVGRHPRRGVAEIFREDRRVAAHRRDAAHHQARQPDASPEERPSDFALGILGPPASADVRTEILGRSADPQVLVRQGSLLAEPMGRRRLGVVRRERWAARELREERRLESHWEWWDEEQVWVLLSAELYWAAQQPEARRPEHLPERQQGAGERQRGEQR
jgi:hypothetical protein